jgi:plastocyanin
MRRWAPLAAGLAIAMAAAGPASADACDLIVEAVRSGPGAAWTTKGADPAVITLTSEGDTVTWSLVGDRHTVVTVTSESMPAAAHSTTDGSVVDIGSALQVREGTPSGSVEGAARVTLCLAGIPPETGTGWLGQGAALVAGAAAVAVASIAVGRRIAAR